MAANRGNITGVHFALIFFVMLSIILGVVSYLKISESSELREKAAQAEKEKTKANTEWNNKIEELEKVKKALGIDVARAAQGDQLVSVEDQIRAKLLRVQGLLNRRKLLEQGEVMPTTMAAALDMLRNKLDNRHQQLVQNQQDLEQEKRDRAAVVQTHEQAMQVATNQIARVSAEKNQLQQDYDELRQSTTKQITALQDQNRQLDIEKRQQKDQLEAVIKKLNGELGQLALANRELRTQLDELQKVTFEVADGQIQWVDHVAGLVWINLGSSDHLPNRTTFSVYRKTHHGVGRGKEDIKGSIEVIRIMEPHLAEARILENDLSQPIAAGDPIYTPLWTPGRKLSFALVGKIDLDGDGQDDRERLRAIVKNAGGEIVHEVTDDGRRLYKGVEVKRDQDGNVPLQYQIDVNTKFLIVGEEPDPATQGADADEKKQMESVLAHYANMRREAQMKGVRIVKLDDFLAWIGFKPTRRLWRPGTEYPYTLKAGARSTAVDETIGDRASTGRTSGIYTRRGRIKQPTSSGTTSKLFRGGRRGY